MVSFKKLNNFKKEEETTKVEKYIHQDYRKIVSSVLSLAFTAISLSNENVTTWWHYILLIILVFVIYLVFYFLLFIVSLLYAKFSKPKIGFSNAIKLNEMLSNLQKLYELETTFDNCKSDEYKMLLTLSMSKLIKLTTDKKNLLWEGNTGKVKVKGSSKELLKTIEATEFYLNSVAKKIGKTI